ncbi:hypothetical protein BGX31_006087 [Mortierella sp. GBA43]|nr:hypothetical protein BGX31_006087 [Mortierella sp. GBA43]
MSASSSSSADPRRPDRIVEYKPEVKRIEDDDPDVHGFVAIFAAVVGLMIRASTLHTCGVHHSDKPSRRDSSGHKANRTALWVGMIFSVESYLNQRASEGGLMGSPGATIVFSISTLLMNYLPEILAFYNTVKA